MDIEWDAGAIALVVRCEADAVPWIATARAVGAALTMAPGLPLVDVVTVADGRAPASGRLVHSRLGAALRYRAHRASPTALTVELADDAGTAAVTVDWRAVAGVPAVHASVRVRATGEEPLVLRSVTSFSARPGAGDWALHAATSEWCGEGRWSAVPVATGPRGAHRLVSTGTWSTGRVLPTAALVGAGGAWLWQLEHSGPWRADAGTDERGAWFALAGPTDDDHAFSRVLAPGESFTTVPVTVALGADLPGAVAALTRYRRAARRAHPDAAALPVVFNDYMNTLEGDPTTAALEPLVDAAAEAGAEVFCIDAGWYADGPWWDLVGEWRPARGRFPGGIERVLDRIRDRGMVPGLWVEPEVVGVASPAADRLPAEAFLVRHGQRVVEHGRYHLDLRHPAAIAHLDEALDRLVTGQGVGYVKFDHNSDPGAGTDRDADSPGDGLLGHAREHHAWLDALLDRHPALVVENCASGAMRSDFALLSRLQLQSTSDQTDPLAYPAIAAAAPMQMLPEQAANWAYPQPGMSPERIAFCLVTGLAGRFYLSGHLDGMSAAERALVAEGVAAAKAVRHEVARAVPVWPLGLPRADDAVVALGLDTGGAVLVAVWDRLGGARMELPLAGAREIETVFPTSLPPWDAAISDGVLRLANPAREPAARLLRVRR